MMKLFDYVVAVIENFKGRPTIICEHCKHCFKERGVVYKDKYGHYNSCSNFYYCRKYFYSKKTVNTITGITSEPIFDLCCNHNLSGFCWKFQPKENKDE